MITILFIAAVLFGFIILIWAADRFVEGASQIAVHLGVSPLIIGLTIVGFGTSAPEMLVSALAALDGAPAMGIGNAIGSNITNIGLVLGITILITPLVVHSDTLKREFPMLALIMFIAYLLVRDHHLDFLDGVMLFTGFILTVLGMTWLAIHSRQSDRLEQEFEFEIQTHQMTMKQAVLQFFIGLFSLLLASKMLVWGATGIAHLLGISDLIIGLTIVAIGTSLPELAASVASALKGEHDIAIGNVLGSNMFNLLAVLAMPGLIHPSSLPPLLLSRDFFCMALLTALLYLFSRFSKHGKIGRPAGLLLLSIYLSYSVILAYHSLMGVTDV